MGPALVGHQRQGGRPGGRSQRLDARHGRSGQHDHGGVEQLAVAGQHGVERGVPGGLGRCLTRVPAEPQPVDGLGVGPVELGGIGREGETDVVDHAGSDGVDVGGDRVEDVVGHHHQRGVGDELLGLPGPDLPRGGGVDDGEVDPPAGHVLLQPGVAGQLLQLRLVEVGEHHGDPLVAHRGRLQQLAQAPDHPVGQPARPRPQLEDVHGAIAVEAAGGVAVAEEGNDHLGVGRRHDRV